MLARLHQLLCGLPFPEPIPNHLRAEFAALPAATRRQLMRKAAQRELALTLDGQRRRLVKRIPDGTRRVLWWFTWDTVGDAIMDLSSRFLLPDPIEVELLIRPALAPLFAADRRFARVHTSLETCAVPDMLLLQYLNTKVMRAKRRHWRDVPFATLLGHTSGEMFSRVHHADRRMRQLLGLPPGEPTAPRLDLPAAPSPFEDDGRCHVAVALGARDERRRYARWADALDETLRRWPGDVPPPRFHLLGTANARPDLAALPGAWIARHADNHVERLTLLECAQLVARCDAFVGADGGLMHVAAATGTPGVAMFGPVPPAYRLLPGSPIAALAEDGGGPVAPQRLAQALVDRVGRRRAAGGDGVALQPLDAHA